MPTQLQLTNALVELGIDFESEIDGVPVKRGTVELPGVDYPRAAAVTVHWVAEDGRTFSREYEVES